MIKVRLEGEPEEVEEFKKFLVTVPRLYKLSESDDYPNRGKSKYVRVYLDMKLNELTQDDYAGLPRIGETIYFITQKTESIKNKYFIESAEVTEIIIDESGATVCWAQSERVGADQTLECCDEGELDYSELGRTWFLTEHEAETKRDFLNLGAKV